MVRSSANPLTLYGLEQLVEEDPVMSFVGRNHLSVPCAGCHFSSPSFDLFSEVPFAVLQVD